MFNKKHIIFKKIISVTAAAAISIALLLGCTINVSAYQQEVKTVRVGYVNMVNYQEGGDGEYKQGYGYEYLQKVAGFANWKYEYVYGSFTEMLEMLKNGEIDLMGNISYKPDREEYMYFSKLAQGKENYFIYVKDDENGDETISLEELKGKTIGVTKNSYQEALFRDWMIENGFDCKIELCGGSKELLQKLTDGEIDAMVLTDVSTVSGYVAVEHIGGGDYYFAVTKSRPDLLADLNRAMEDIKSTSPFFNDNLYAKYYADSLFSTTLTSEEKQWLKDHGNTVRIGYLDNNLPYSATGEDGRVKGVIGSLVDTFEQEYGIAVEYVRFDNGLEIEKALIDGAIDMCGPMYANYWLAEQYGLMDTDAFSTASEVLVYISEEVPDDLPQRRAGYIIDDAVQYSMISLKYGVENAVGYDDINSLIKGLHNKEVDFTVIPSTKISFYQDYYASGHLNFMEIPEQVGICMCMVKGNSELLMLTNRIIFASKNKLNGISLTNNVGTQFSWKKYIETNALMVFSVMLVIVVVLVILFVNYAFLASKVIATEKHNAQLAEQAFKDQLTQLGNRGAFFVEEESININIAKSEQQQFAVVIADINNLKEINDTFGHNVGDMLIQNAGRYLKKAFPNQDIYRIGGDEFAVILRGEGYLCRDRLIKNARDNSIKAVTVEDVMDGKISMAFGIAEYESGIDTVVSDVAKRADEQMYKSKAYIKDYNGKYSNT